MEHRISHGRAIQLSKEHGWTLDVGLRSRERAAKALAQSNPELPSTLAQALDAATAAIVTIRREHRTAIGQQRGLVDDLVAEVAALTHDRGLRRLVQEAMQAADADDAKRIDAMQLAVNRATALAKRANVTRTLVEAQKVLIALERQAYDLDAATDLDARRPPPDRTMTPAEIYRWLARDRGGRKAT